MKKRKALISCLTLLGITGTCAAVSVGLTSCSESSAKKSYKYQDTISSLFNFPNNFLPNMIDKTALLDKNYNTFVKAQQDFSSASDALMNLIKNKLINDLGIDENALLSMRNASDNRRSYFHYTFSIDLTNDICQKFYQKSLEDIKNEIQDSDNYDEMFEINSNVPSNINSIKLKFDLNQYTVPQNGKTFDCFGDNLVGFVLNQTANLTFENGNPINIKDINNANNMNMTVGTKKLFFVKFDQNSSEEDGATIELPYVQINQEQYDKLESIVSQNLANWTKRDIIDNTSKKNELITQVNNFFKENNLELSIKSISGGTSFVGNQNGYASLRPYLNLNEFTLIDTPTQNLFSSYSTTYIGTGFLLFLNDKAMVTSAKIETLNLSQNDIKNIKDIVNEGTSLISEVLGNDHPGEPFSTIVNQVNNYFQNINDGKFEVSTNVWGGCSSYHIDNNSSIVMDLAIHPHLIDTDAEENTFVRIQIPSSSAEQNVETSTYLFDDFLVFKNSNTAIPSPYIVTQEICENINQILTEFTASLTVEKTNEHLYQEHGDVVDQINAQLQQIDPSLEMTGFNVWGGWATQNWIDGPDGNCETVQLAITLNELNKTEHCITNNLAFDFKGGLFYYNETYNSIVPKEAFKTQINPPILIKPEIADNINQILTEFAATITKEEWGEELYEHNPDFAARIDAELKKCNENLRMTAFNVWGGWWAQKNVDDYVNIQLAIHTNADQLGFPIKTLFKVEGNKLHYDNNQYYNTLVGNGWYKTGIKTINSTISENINNILSEFAEKLTNIEDIKNGATLFNKDPQTISKINAELAKINPELKVTEFNVWGGWTEQKVVDGKYQIKLAFNTNAKEILYPINYNYVNKDNTAFTCIGYDNKYFMVPNTEYKTNIKNTPVQPDKPSIPPATNPEKPSNPVKPSEPSTPPTPKPESPKHKI